MNASAWFLVIAVFVIALYDVGAAIAFGPRGTLSYEINSASHNYPIIAFAFGIICGHLFWPNPNHFTPK
jgi:hypothetical protein